MPTVVLRVVWGRRTQAFNSPKLRRRMAQSNSAHGRAHRSAAADPNNVGPERRRRRGNEGSHWHLNGHPCPQDENDMNALVDALDNDPEFISSHDLCQHIRHYLSRSVFCRQRALYGLYTGGCYVWLVHGRVLYVACRREGAILLTGGCRLYTRGRESSCIVCTWKGALWCFISFAHGRVPNIVCTRVGAVRCLYTEGEGCGISSVPERCWISFGHGKVLNHLCTWEGVVKNIVCTQ